MRFFATCSLLSLSLASTLAHAAIPADLDTTVNQDYPRLEKLYLGFHQHPELSFHESETGKHLAKELKALGFTVTAEFGGHGVVAVLKNGDGPTVLLRTDMDALPIKEQTGLPYASQVVEKNDEGKDVPVMHACGHDVHMTVFLGTAKQLAQRKHDWKGTLVMIGQPAEERSGGAKAMLADGLFEKFPRPDYNLALHTSASVPAGKLAYSEGYAFANVDQVDITVHGVGGHGAYPQKTKDPIVLASQMVLAFQTIVSRETPPLEAAVVTVGSIHGGTQHNIIPDDVKLQLTIRTYKDDVRKHTLAAIERIAKNLALAAGLDESQLPTLKWRDEATPAAYNNPALTEHLVKVFQNLLGPDNVQSVEPTMAGEDFGRYGLVEPKIPSLIFWLGGVDPKTYQAAKSEGKELPGLHSAQFAPLPEPTLKTGVKALTAATLDLFNNRPSL